MLHDTSFSGPYLVTSVVKGDLTFGLNDTLLYYSYNPTAGDQPTNWGTSLHPDSARGDTMYFHIPAIPQGLETPVKVGYGIWARNTGYEENTSPATGYFHFINTVYSPRYANTSILRDTFYNGPLVVRTSLTTAYGDSVANDYIYSDLLGGATYPRDSVGADGYYYYAIPRHPGNTQTPVKAFWYLGASDTLGNTASYPLQRDTLNHFQFVDPKPSNIHTIANTSQLGPYPVWVNYKAEGHIICDSLWVDAGAGYAAYPRDSVGTADPSRYYYTVPPQSIPVVIPGHVNWYLKATDSTTGNYTYLPDTALSTPYSFYVYDRTPPAISAVTAVANMAIPGPSPITATCQDTSGVFQVRVYYRVKPSADTVWSQLPMFPTGAPHQYRASVPLASEGSMVQYFIAAVDSAQNEGGTLLRNTGFYPAGGQLTPWQYFVGSQANRLLLVNDELPANNFEGVYTASLDTTGVLYGYWDNRKANVLPALHNFNTLIWFTGEDSLTTLSQTDRDSLTVFLDRGGNLLISSKNLGQNIGDTSVFYHDYLKAQYYSNRSTQFNLKGQNAYPISNGLVDTLTVSGGTITRSIDVVTPRAGADSVFTFNSIGRCGVVRCSTAAFKTVYSTLPLEGLSKNSNGRVSRTYFLARCLRWFGMTAFYKVDDRLRPALAGSDLRLFEACPNPFRGDAIITYQLPAAAAISLKVYNIAGQLVKTLAQRQMTAGRHSVRWNGRDDTGRAVTSGVYFYQLATGGEQVTSKVTVMR